ncbi:MAG: pantoate--beta-alanine ligase [Mariprofundaceae bacterium]|nr:pantoate--beta-alanine ligase [Mariprofundaceae bacterium]
MQVIKQVQALRRYLSECRQDSIALVPTMGCLHAGHVSLIRKAKRLADVVVVSIYVNHLQFSEGEDFEQYPRTFEDDVKICVAEGVDVLFQPKNLYTDDGVKISLQVHEMDGVLCGVSRLGHFDGVVTVVNMLFNIVQPNLAIFGEKDWQQLTILRRMVADLHIPISVVGSALVREDDGLAMSSRNRYLTDLEREKALFLSQILQKMQALAAQGESKQYIISVGLAYLQEADIDLDYLEIRDEQSLLPATAIPKPTDRIFVAAMIGHTRLIDNMPLLKNLENVA